MIGYRITAAEWREAIRAVAPTWLARAADRTATYAEAGRYTEPPSKIWSEIKSVYMDIQGFKCGFCERKLEKSEFGNIEHDVEHFRPKGLVTSWPPDSDPERGAGLGFELGDPADPGYFLLAHHHENYLISCKTCNTALKRNGFPVEGTTRNTEMVSPRHPGERHFLVYPVGMFDEDPQKLIRFEGIVPVPAARSGHRRRRGQVIINFFQLAERDGLLEERSMTVLGLHLALISVDHPDQLSRQLAEITIERMTGNAAVHANCARSFRALWAQSRADAEIFSQEAFDHLTSLP